jgi:predicted O-methyltransferase YrrM
MLRADLATFIPENGVGVELGVAAGAYSRILLERHPTLTLYSVDRWGGDRGHGNVQFRRAYENLRWAGERSIIVRAFFEDALVTFCDGIFDFIYIDGYAHTGQDDGRTLEQWWPKLRVGGIFAGHDYSPHWPKTVHAVDRFLQEKGLTPGVTDEPSEPNTTTFPSWFVLKER